MFIKSDKQVAYDNVNHLLRLTSDQFADAAERFEDRELSDWFHALSAERHLLSEQLEEEIRRMGELPTRPDPDNELFKNLLVGIREQLSHDHLRFELEQREQLENDLAQALMEAASYPAPPDLEEVLAKINQHVTTVRQQISDRMPGQG